MFKLINYILFYLELCAFVYGALGTSLTILEGEWWGTVVCFTATIVVMTVLITNDIREAK